MSYTRRGFVLGAMSAAALPAVSSRYASRLQFVIDGPVNFDYVVWNPFLNPQPDFSNLPNAEVRLRNYFPYQQRDLIETFVYLALPTGVAPISLFYTEVEDVLLTDAVGNPAKPTLSLMGKIVANPIGSPFGSLTGKPACFSGNYEKTGSSTRFEFFAGMTGGSHVTILREAFGSLSIQGSAQSF